LQGSDQNVFWISLDIVNLPVVQRRYKIQDAVKFPKTPFSSCKEVTHLPCIKDTVPVML